MHIGGCLTGQAVHGNQQTFSRCMGQPASCHFSRFFVTSVQLSPHSLYFPGTINMCSSVHMEADEVSDHNRHLDRDFLLEFDLSSYNSHLHAVL